MFQFFDLITGQDSGALSQPVNLRAGGWNRLSPRFAEGPTDKKKTFPGQAFYLTAGMLFINIFETLNLFLQKI